jgi:hypothetical protein
MVGLPFPLRWGFRACMQLLHQHTRRKIRMCRATDVPHRLPSQLRSHKLSLAAGMDNWAFLETQSYYGDVPLDSTGYHYAGDAAVGDMTGGGAGGGSVVGSELGPTGDPFTPRTPRSGMVRGVGPLRRFRWRRKSRAAKEGAVGVAGGSSSQRLRVRLVKHGAWVLLGVTVVAVVYLALLQWLLPTVGEPLVHRLAAVLQVPW